jgi:hypothetical protein
MGEVKRGTAANRYFIAIAGSMRSLAMKAL